MITEEQLFDTLDQLECEGNYFLRPKIKDVRIATVCGQECVLVPLTRDRLAIVDFDDAPVVLQYNWYLFRGGGNHFYAARKILKGEITLFMHQFLGCAAGLIVDHWNGNGLDNRRCNLRPGTQTDNRINTVKRFAKTSSIHKGVHWLKRERRWRAKIQYYQQDILIGYFKSESEAVEAYQRKAIELFGSFAVSERPKENTFGYTYKQKPNIERETENAPY